MNVITTYHTATREYGVCKGTIWRSATSLSSICDYAVLCGVVLSCYESASAFDKGDAPLTRYVVVGAGKANDACFHIMTDQGTHLSCQAPTTSCRDIWVTSLQAGLEMTLSAPLPLKFTPPQPQKTLRQVRSKKHCFSCGVNDTTTSVPLWQYGKEFRTDVCENCSIAQGLVDYTEFCHDLLKSAEIERSSLEQARLLCLNAVQGLMATSSTTPEEDDKQSSASTSDSWQHVADDSERSTTPSPPQIETSGEWQAVIEEDSHQQWIHLPPTQASTKALVDLMQDTKFTSLARLSPTLQSLQNEVINGWLGVNELLEQLDVGVGKVESPQAAMKKQAFRMAGDMGTAMKLVLDSALRKRDSDLLACILEFFLELCETEISSVAFFWPQLCHIHLRMLPPSNAREMARVELMEDFLLTVACRYSIHLALELVWSHTADLQESMGVVCANACRRRRFAVLKFVCELESLLFDFENGWGGGSVSLGKMLSPTGHQVELLKSTMKKIQSMRLTCPNRLSRSFRYDVLSTSKFDKPPDEAAKEKLRIARNADYFSSHLNFSARICDIAEKLRFLELERRPSALEEELQLLNASGAMGGDPLNHVRDSQVRVVRVPPTEGHVFRSKERTPVLLLMEIMDEGMASDEMSVESEARESEHELTIDTGNNSEVLESAQSSQALSESDHKSPTPMRSSLGSVDILEGAHSEDCKPSPRPAGLKRFDGQYENVLDNPTTPRADMELLVNSVMEAQISDIVLPNLVPSEEEAVIPPLAMKVQDIEADDSKLDDDKKEAEVHGAQREVVQSSEVEETGEARVVESASGEDAALEKKRDDQAVSSPESSPRKEPDRRGSKKLSSFGSRNASPHPVGASSKLAATGDVRREVLNAIMMRGLQGDVLAAGAADSVQRSLQELERQRATELLMDGSERGFKAESDVSRVSYSELDNTKQKLASLGFGAAHSSGSDSEGLAAAPSEEDEVMEAVRLLLVQNRVAQGQLSPADAAKVLQHVTLNRSNSDISLASYGASLDSSDMPTIDAGDVDRRLVGCGPLPPAILQALTLWKGKMVSNAELLELVKKDLEFLRHSVLLEAEHMEKLNEDSAFWGRFAFGERWAEKKSRIASTSPQATVPGWDLTGVIVKSNDDLRQESFVMQLIELCQEAFDLAGLELWVHPYRILATGRTTGVIEMVRNAMSFDALKKRPGYGKGGLREHLQRMTEFTADPGEAFKTAQRNFVRSLAAYSLMSYFFLFKDRHNGNILLDTAGHVIHIDFGFVFGIAPGGSFSLEMSTPFKLTEEMLEVMGGMKSPLFSEFVTLFCCGFLALQAYSGTFLTIVEIMCKDSTFKCFDGRDTDDIVAKLRERFCPDMSKEETVAYALDLIKQATSSYGTRQYDLFQYLSQGIAT